MDIALTLQKITSTQNQLIKNLVKLREKRARQKSQTFLVEGAREISRALASGYELNDLFIYPDLVQNEDRELIQSIDGNKTRVYEINKECFGKIAIREERDGLMAVFQQKHFCLKDLKFKSAPLIVALEHLEKPGNLGAVLRSADGAGVDAIVLLENSVDLYNPNVIRSSLGAVFSVPVVVAKNEEFLEFTKQHKLATFTAALSDRSNYYTNFSFDQPVAFILGNEANGVTSFWFEQSDHLIKIPMMGIADSLNVSVAGSVLMYESLRQRNSAATFQ